MRLYCLQIHTTDCDPSLDEVYIFHDYDNLVLEYKNKFGNFKTNCQKMIEKEEPSNEDGEVFGGFTFENDNGSLTIGRCYDYDVLDDDD